MPKIGFARSRPKFSVEAAVVLAVFGSANLIMNGDVRSQELASYRIVGDAIPASLTGTAGDVAHGRAIVTARQNTCLLCHAGPFPEEKFQGNLAPDLRGTGARWSEGQLRLRIVDARRVNPATIMPPFYIIEGLTRVAAPWRGKPILSAQQIEDVVAYLATLRE